MTRSTLFCSTCGALIEEAHSPCLHCGQAEQEEASTQAIPLLRERYQREKLLGSGGFSAVYQARDLLINGRLVAIKEITLQGLSADEVIEATETFNREVQILSVLNHAQVPTLYEHFSDQEHWYLVLEYIKGQTLEDFLAEREAQRRPLTLDEILSIASQLCLVLDYLHTRQPPIVFRDLKPGNIMRTPAGSLYLIDFGIARYYRPGQRRDTQRLGSPGYAAPEQYGRAQSSPRSDIYSLGALLSFLLSGQDPADKRLSLSPLRLNGQPGSAELESLVSRMLLPDPDERPGSIQEVAARLAAVREQKASKQTTSLWTPPTPQTPPALHVFSRQQHLYAPAQVSKTASKGFLTRRKVLTGLGALAITGMSITLGIKLTAVPQRHPIQSYRLGANLYQEYAGFDHASSSASLSIAWSPNSAFIVATSETSSTEVWNTLNGHSSFQYEHYLSSLKFPAWSPDGTFLAACSSEKTVEVRNMTTDQVVLVYDEHAARVNSVSWSPSGDLLASASEDYTVKIWSAKTGQTLLTYQRHSYPVKKVVWSPDGRYLASFDLYTLQIWEPDGNRVWSISNTNIDWTGSWAWSPNGQLMAIASPHQVRIWDVSIQEVISAHNDSNNYQAEILWSPDGQYIASRSEDSMQIWQVSNGSTIWSYQGHPDAAALQGESNNRAEPNSMAWSPNSQYIATAGNDKVQVWNATTGNKILECVAHDNEQMQSVRWAPDGGIIAAVGIYHKGYNYYSDRISVIETWQAP